MLVEMIHERNGIAGPIIELLQKILRRCDIDNGNAPNYALMNLFVNAMLALKNLAKEC
jgi:hypothetical protein